MLPSGDVEREAQQHQQAVHRPHAGRPTQRQAKSASIGSVSKVAEEERACEGADCSDGRAPAGASFDPSCEMSLHARSETALRWPLRFGRVPVVCEGPM